ncbi:AraC family transcriptional regulator [Microbacterium gorillae]|uniref:AraC family transcriptional regulator n=1 Tax=Microbacterium gorillae TaxID=1231063 RepID=UPI00058E3F7C|nr:AraC family transcriptional regulator [Microbacterium gorillae]
MGELSAVAPGRRVAPVLSGPRSDTFAAWEGRRLGYVHYTGGGVAFTRNGAEVRARQSADLQFAMLLAGRARVTYDHRAAVVGAGTVMPLMADDPHEAILEPGSDLAVLYVPATVLEARGIEPRRLASTTWGMGPVERVLVELGDTIAGLDAADALAVEAGMFETLLALLSAHDVTEHEDIAAQARARVLALIEEGYTDPGLDAAALARRLGVSRRYLYALFEGRGLSIAALVRNRRVAHAQLLLSDDPRIPLRRVARLSGLGSEDRLLRTFKTVLGMSPSVFRNQAAAETRARMQSRDSAVG